MSPPEHSRIAFTLPLSCFLLSLPRCKELKYSKELPQISIIFIFVNEALSVILRSVHSAVNHTPTHLLKEIILVDDNSDEGKGAATRMQDHVVSRMEGHFPPRGHLREGAVLQEEEVKADAGVFPPGLLRTHC